MRSETAKRILDNTPQETKDKVSAYANELVKSKTMNTITLANGDELLIMPTGSSNMELRAGVRYYKIGTLTVHEDRSVSVGFEPKAEWVDLQPEPTDTVREMFINELESQLPLVNPYEALKPYILKGSENTLSIEEMKLIEEAESRLMKPGKYIVIIKTK